LVVIDDVTHQVFEVNLNFNNEESVGSGPARSLL
jgi:hypothetical protein